MDRRQFSQEEDPYSIPFTMSENSVLNMDTLRDPKPPKLPPRDIEKVPVPTVSILRQLNFIPKRSIL